MQLSVPGSLEGIMNPTIILMELQAAAARIMRPPIRGRVIAADVTTDQEVLESMPLIRRVSGARQRGRGGRRSVFQREHMCEE